MKQQTAHIWFNEQKDKQLIPPVLREVTHTHGWIYRLAVSSLSAACRHPTATCGAQRRREDPGWTGARCRSDRGLAPPWRRRDEEEAAARTCQSSGGGSKHRLTAEMVVPKIVPGGRWLTPTFRFHSGGGVTSVRMRFSVSPTDAKTPGQMSHSDTYFKHQTKERLKQKQIINV